MAMSEKFFGSAFTLSFVGAKVKLRRGAFDTVCHRIAVVVLTSGLNEAACTEGVATCEISRNS
jgi:hypothetical protein